MRDLGALDLASRDLVAEPFTMPLDLKGTPDGSYRLTAAIADGSDSLVTLQQTIAVADGIESRAADTEHRLARIQGHDSAKASVRWPFDMARVVNLGIRKLESVDFGLPEAGGQVFDFPKELRESGELLKALESGKDPLVRAKGDHERHYWFEEAAEIMPYRVYVPSTLGWRSVSYDDVRYARQHQGPQLLLRSRWRHTGEARREERLYCCHHDGLSSERRLQRSAIAPRRETAQALLRSPAMQRETELSEKDAMYALDLVVKEFNPDPKRIYLFGHSAGGTGGGTSAVNIPNGSRGSR